MKILVVDDSPAMRMLVLRGLRQAGYGDTETDQAEDGAQALDKIRQSCPDLVLADWNMPNMNGIELLENLRHEDIQVKFGFITTETNTEMRKRATDAGASFLLAKPFTEDSFQRAVSSVLG